MSNLARDLSNVLVRELDRVADEIAAYRDERNLWVTLGAQRNAPGTLALHLAGNLEHFVGAGLGSTGYVRDRAAEFGDRDVPQTELVARLHRARDTIASVLGGMSDEALLGATFTVDLPDAYRDHSAHGLLVHLIWHLGWHQGQIYYHRLAVEPPESATD